MNLFELKAYCEVNSKAILLLRTATSDYAGARCLMINGLGAGFSLGAQAIEKFLKASLLLADPSIKVRNLSHNLLELLTKSECHISEIAELDLRPMAQRFERYYQTRYPDNPNQPQGMDTIELNELDRFVIGIYTCLPCPRNVRFRTGLYADITFSLNKNSPYMTHIERWIKERNTSLAAIWPDIEAQYPLVMQELYPQPLQNV